ncbi:MAG: deoxyguanosinetriphosphate triphosphohydrolase [Alphaproteobacteria bacterium]|nr:deoxyguanosinetriphosphate triphosphohydrolase [Alphaproteobacteria bacterium]PHY00379.1 MAG: deoxyguanosinetriphosphate triphosphohydrolase [Rhodospirillaceae bacterium]
MSKGENQGISALAGSMASIACDPAMTRGRLHAEPEAATRTAYQRDRDRIIHCGAFRRLKHKTQVFVYDYEGGDHHRTRLTHSLEVAQIARSISRFLGLNEDMAEALALAHDMGHTCFGHAGEDALKECMVNYNGFDHNAQSLRLVTKLEKRYFAFDGLNLTWDTLEGLVKHNGPLLGQANSKPLPLATAEYNATHDLELATWPSAEAQVAAISDDIAYNTHDIEDGLRAKLFTIDDLLGVPFVGQVFNDIADANPGLDTGVWIHESIRRIIGAMVNDVITESHRRFVALKPKTTNDVRALGTQLCGFSVDMAAKDKALKEFLWANMYRHAEVNRMTVHAQRVVQDLFGALLGDPGLLPEAWRKGLNGSDKMKTARRMADYIAGMTDRFAQDEHTRLFVPRK